MKKPLIALTCGLMFAFAASPALALTASNTDPGYLGSVTPGTPTGPQNEVDYINFLISLAINTTNTNSTVSPPNPDTFVRSDNVCGVDLSCPTASLTGAETDLEPPSTNTINVSGFTWLYLKYGVGDGAGAYVFNVAGLTTVTIPLNNDGGTALSHWALFGPTTTVPDGGTTMSLLGLGLLGLGYLRARKQ